MAKFFLETGVVSEAAYSYTFTDFLKILSSEFERGSRNGDERFKNIGNKLSDLIKYMFFSLIALYTHVYAMLSILLLIFVMIVVLRLAGFTYGYYAAWSF